MAKQPKIPGMPSFPSGAVSLDNLVRRNQVPPDLVWDPENPQTVNACTGGDVEHTSECDGNCERVAVDEYDIKLENENRAWARVGLDGKQLSGDIVRMEAQVVTLIKLIQDKLEISDREFNDTFKPHLLELKQTIRSGYENAVRMQGIAPNNGPML